MLFEWCGSVFDFLPCADSQLRRFEIDYLTVFLSDFSRFALCSGTGVYPQKWTLLHCTSKSLNISKLRLDRLKYIYYLCNTNEGGTASPGAPSSQTSPGHYQKNLMQISKNLLNYENLPVHLSK